MHAAILCLFKIKRSALQSISIIENCGKNVCALVFSLKYQHFCIWLDKLNLLFDILN